jgi:hypothetical protein
VYRIASRIDPRREPAMIAAITYEQERGKEVAA